MFDIGFVTLFFYVVLSACAVQKKEFKTVHLYPDFNTTIYEKNVT